MIYYLRTCAIDRCSPADEYAKLFYDVYAPDTNKERHTLLLVEFCFFADNDTDNFTLTVSLSPAHFARMIKWRLFVLFWISFTFAVVSFCHTILIKRTNEEDQKLKEKTSAYLLGEKKRIRTEIGKERDRKYQKERGIHTKYTKKEIERNRISQQNELKGEELKAFNESAQRYRERRASYDAKRYAKNKIRKAEKQISLEEVKMNKVKKQKQTKTKGTAQKKTIVNTSTGIGTSALNKVQKSTETMRTFAQMDLIKANRLALEEIPFEFQPHKRPKKSDS